MNEIEELVFAIPTKLLWNLLAYKEQGFIQDDNDILEIILQKSQFHKRNELEEDASFKQIIPYGVISCKDSFYLFKRRSGQTEKRLQNMYSLGVGGHMNPGTLPDHDVQYLTSELKRELFEEVRLLPGCSLENIEFIGFINDDTIPVGRVHVGLLFNIQVSNKEVYINETDKMQAGWTDRQELADLYREMETWSRIAFDHLIK